MRAHPNKARFIVLVAAVVLGAAFLSRSRLHVAYHKWACDSEEIAAINAGQGRFGIVDKIRRVLGRAPGDHSASLAYHQQALVAAGVLARRDVTLENDYGLAWFSPSNLLSHGGERAHIWFNSKRELTVFAEPERIEQMTRWLHEQDSNNH